jgi:Ca2+:H+ antiporter
MSEILVGSISEASETVGLSQQIALFAAPVLVLLSFVIGPNPMALVFNGFELAAILLSVLIAVHVTDEGESTWYEGVQLLAVYAVLAPTFFFA